MLTNERKTFKLLKWLSKAIIVINWFSRGAQAGIILEKYINKCKYIKQNYYMYHESPEHALKS